MIKLPPSKKIIEVFEKVERTLIRLKVLPKAARNLSKKEYREKLNHFRSANDNDFYLKIALVTFFSGFKASIVENKRGTIRKYFGNYKKVQNYKSTDIKLILNDKKMIKNKLKITSLIKNAKTMKKVVDKYGSFRNYLLSFNKDYPISDQNIK